MISLKKIKTTNGVLLAACDFELLGKNFREGGLKLNVKEDFYKGEVVDIKTYEKNLEEATIINLVGKKVVKKAIELRLVSECAVLKIQGIPHAQIFKMS